MARKKRHEEHVNHEGWAIPYGDLITLLLAFFVVMYAISSVNEGKFRVLSESMVSAFQGKPMAPTPIQIGEPTRALHAWPESMPTTMVPQETFRSQVPMDGLSDHEVFERLRGDEADSEALKEAAERMLYIGEAIEQAMAPLIAQELIRLHRDRFWLEVEINTSLLFASGNAQLFPQARPVLQQLAMILREFPVRVHAEGFTDDVPINTAVFPSNWELSGARAASVLRLLIANGLDPTDMAAVGFGEYRPVADNQTAEGRRQNRRVTLVILSQRDQGHGVPLSPTSLREDFDRLSAPSRLEPEGAMELPTPSPLDLGNGASEGLESGSPDPVRLDSPVLDSPVLDSPVLDLPVPDSLVPGPERLEAFGLDSAPLEPGPRAEATVAEDRGADQPGVDEARVGPPTEGSD